ncbi:MAG: class I SAM-dependent methyltransferase [Bacteroidota bacterium]
MESPENKDISKFYDDYTAHQKKIGVNIRHRTILKNLKKNGLRPDSRVLEVGCGIGSVTQLIARYCSRGRVVAVDISPKSIDIAKKLHKNLRNIEFLVSDMSDFSHQVKFDFVVLPDVLEHIPVENHRHLFRIIRDCTHPDSTVFINIPDPRYLKWVQKHRPDLLQVIDQALSTDELLNNIYPNDFYLVSLNTYSLGVKEGDYQCLVLKRNKELDRVTYKSKMEKVVQEIKSRL